jgi:hypothetical protein
MAEEVNMVNQVLTLTGGEVPLDAGPLMNCKQWRFVVIGRKRQESYHQMDTMRTSSGLGAPWVNGPNLGKYWPLATMQEASIQI